MRKVISPGELECGQWVMSLGTVKKEKDFNTPAEEAALAGMVAIINQEIPTPHVVLAVELPFMVVGDCFSGARLSCRNQIITKIWRTDEKELMELSTEFVRAYDPQGFKTGEEMVRSNAEAKKLNKSSDAA